MPVRHGLDGEGPVIVSQVVIPDDIAAQISGDRIQLGPAAVRIERKQFNASPGCAVSGDLCSEVGQTIGRNGAGGERLVGVEDMRAVDHIEYGLHVIGSIGAHAGDENGGCAATSRGRHRRGGESIAGIRTKLNVG